MRVQNYSDQTISNLITDTSTPMLWDEAWAVSIKCLSALRAHLMSYLTDRGYVDIGCSYCHLDYSNSPLKAMFPGSIKGPFLSRINIYFLCSRDIFSYFKDCTLNFIFQIRSHLLLIKTVPYRYKQRSYDKELEDYMILSISDSIAI